MNAGTGAGGSATERLIDALASATGLHPRRSGAGYMARCPAHNDRDPSLSVRGTEGQALIRCHAGCDTRDVLAALGLTMRDLYDDPQGVAYRYEDQDGRVTRTVHRSPDKRFRQSGELKLKQLYRLPRVLAAVKAGQTVYLVEGEKDVHTLESMGVVATTGPEGAANFDKVDVSPLKGATVIAVRDRDASGEKWADLVRDRLDGYALRLTLVEAKDGKDVTDHVMHEHRLEDLVPVGEGWDPPIRIDRIDRIPLPASAGRQPHAVWAFVEAVAESLQVPRDMVFLQVLSVLSTASGGRWRARVRPDWTETLSLYTVTSMLSGSLKSATVREATRPLIEAEKALRSEAEGGRIVAEARRELATAEVDRLKRGASKGKGEGDEMALIDAMQLLADIQVPNKPCLLADDITPERLAMLMDEQGERMGVHSAEGGLFGILAGRYSSGQPNLDLVLKAWSGDPVRVDRIGRPAVQLDEPFLSIGVTIQPDVLEGLAESRLFRGAGLLARFLFALPQPLVGSRNLDAAPIPACVAQQYGDQVRKLATAARDAKEIKELVLTDEARQVLRAFRVEHEPRLDQHGGDLAEIVDWASKLPGQLVRIAALYSLFEDPSTDGVSGEAMREAVVLAPYLVGQARAAFDAINGRTARVSRPHAVLAWLRRKHLTEFSIRDARRDLAGQVWAVDVANVREVVEDLEELGWVRRKRAESRSPGRPSERYQVNPAAFAPARPPKRIDEIAKTATATSSVDFVNASGGSAEPRRPLVAPHCTRCGQRHDHPAHQCAQCSACRAWTHRPDSASAAVCRLCEEDTPSPAA